MFSKHLFYLSNEQLRTWQWRAGQLTPGPAFTADQAGVDGFNTFLAGWTPAPVYLLADLIEEDFQRQLLPHVGGRAGRLLRQRRLAQAYRDTPLRHASFQGREADGRRDDAMLFNALTNPALLQPWLDALEQAKAPLAGLYSASLLSAALLGKLDLTQRHLLLVTQQSGGLRQSYFQDGMLRFSRLSHLSLAVDEDGLASETARTQQFLTSTRLLARGQLLYVAVLAPAARVERLAQLSLDTRELAYEFTDLDSACARSGLDPAGEPLCDRLFMALLGRRATMHPANPLARPASHYALGERGRFYQLWRIRRGLYGASAALLAGALLYSGATLWAGLDATGEADTLRREAQQYTGRYAASMAGLPPAVDKTQNMKAAVTVAQMVAVQAPQPLALMAILAAALDQVPEIKLVQLDWQAGRPGDAPPAPRPDLPAPPVSALLLGIPGKPPQNLRVEAEVVLQQNDYRSALASIDRFAQELARQPKLTVLIEQQALDLRPSVKLAGKDEAASGEASAKFSLNLVWTP